MDGVDMAVEEVGPIKMQKTSFFTALNWSPRKPLVAVVFFSFSELTRVSSSSRNTCEL